MEKIEIPPVSPSLNVIVYKSYVQTPRRWVALCVVSDGSKISLRFYKWKKSETSSDWKVDLARFSVQDIDLKQLASDAVDFARAYKIKLEWLSL